MVEANLIDGCLKNDRIAQRELYDKYKDAMFTLAYRITGDFAKAEDVLQDAFVKVFKNLHAFRRESTLGAWIKTIVIRTAYGLLRKEKVKFDDIEDLSLDSFFEQITVLDTEYLEKAIMSLPEGYRAIFVLIEIEGYSHKEVAEKLNISVGTSKSQLFHAKKKLRAMLEEENVNGD